MKKKDKLNLSVNEDIKEKAKFLSAQTRLTVSDIFALLIQATSVEKIQKLAKKTERK